MKLRNKKTGEIVEPYLEWCSNSDKPHSLAELNEEWEDYEDDDLSKIIEYIDKGLEDEILPVSVNDFVEKLKAWKLLKDECNIKFGGIIRDDKGMLKGVNLSYDRHTVTFAKMQECMNALHLLFGGEE